MFALAPYEGPWRARILRWKYRDEPGHALRIALAMAQQKTLLPPSAVLVPIPSHPARFAERGYNPSALLARYLSGAWRAEHAPLLRKMRSTAQQAGLSEAERSQNLTNAFTCAAGTRLDSFRQKNVVLVDDVATTGSTLRAAASAFLAQGLRVHSAYCAARAMDEARQDQA